MGFLGIPLTNYACMYVKYTFLFYVKWISDCLSNQYPAALFAMSECLLGTKFHVETILINFVKVLANVFLTLCGFHSILWDASWVALFWSHWLILLLDYFCLLIKSLVLIACYMSIVFMQIHNYERQRGFESPILAFRQFHS